ncbi:protein NUCLEAR FUSION DEFECTIVE 4-like [Impatiens glandulifera]|uniref:protein NUCLEAR FUSION DEFECTIVE 4-like n=1 Tax=Impatiens glandulifera TaxID=253017 RepID=UPI001FB084A0|nr:protein NUCLEAR FUSION DEFECTIVE 4-like [Impatiens glandulifera]
MVIPLKGGTRPPWVALGAGVWLQVASGNATNFPLYSHSLKSVLGFNQQQLTLLGVANDIGENVGILPGIACNKFPPWVILSIGAITCFFGYGIIWLAVSGTVQSIPYWLLWIALCIATNSCAWFGTAVLVTNLKNFPLSRGTVAGIIKGYGGISAAIFTEIFGILLKNSATKLLMFLTIGIPVICIALMYFVRPCTPATGEDSEEHGQFLFVQVTSVVLGLYLLSTTILDHMFSLSADVSYVLIIVMVLLLLAPLCVPLKMTFYPSSRSKSYSSLTKLVVEEGNGDKTETEALLVSSNVVEEEDMKILLAEGEGAVVVKKRRPRRGEDFTILEAMIKADFWLLFFVFFAGVGTGVTVLNNLAQIGIAMGTHDATVLLSLFGFCNFVGRLSGGAISEHFVRTRVIPRTIWMTISQVIMAVTYLIFASGLKGTLYPATGVLGVCYGFQFSILVPTASELFGLENFGLIFNIMSLVNPLGAFLFSALLAGHVYDKEAAKQQSLTCIGRDCFGLTFMVMAGVCCVGSLLSVVLTRRIKPVYQSLYAGGSFRLPSSSASH